jgi:ferredoxin-NADP reductase
MIKVKKALHGFATGHIFNTWEKGTEITASAPLGNFYHQSLRDYPFVVGIADSDGIPAFLSMARAIEEKSLNVNLTLFYSCRKRSDAIFMDELISIQQSTRNFKVIFTFSDEKVDNYERGFITKQLIEKYAPPEKFSVFIDGSELLLNLISAQISELGLERKAVRINIGSKVKDARAVNDFPPEFIGKTFELKVKKYRQEGDMQHTYSPLKNLLEEDNSIVNFNTDELSIDLNNPLNIECQPSYDGSVNLILNDNHN